MHYTNIICLFLFLHEISGYSLRATSTKNESFALGYYWVVAKDIHAGHALTCSESGLLPTPYAQQIPWDSKSMETVVQSLGLEIDNYAYGLRGCCVSGLWCHNEACFTQGFGYFQNHGSLVENEALPVFSCMAMDSSIAEPEISLLSYGSNSTFTIRGSDLSVDPSSVVFSVNGNSCYDSEVCSELCRPCSQNPCSSDSFCLSSRDSAQNCYPLCAGPNDLSCPCNSYCKSVTIYSGSYSVPTFICSPDSSGSTCTSSYVTPPDQQELTCRSPNFFDTYVSGVLSNLSVVSKETGNTFQFALHPTNVIGACISDNDCFDDNVCTIDTCNFNLSTCVHQTIENCESVNFRIRQQQSPFSFKVGAMSGLQEKQAEYKQLILNRGTLSDASRHDDYPVDLHQLHFNFSFFGSLISEFGINPNGLISLAPIRRCRGMTSTIHCPVYSTDSNSISLWNADWNPGISAASNIYYLKQYSNSSDSIYDISNVDALHVLYDSVLRYSSSVYTKNANTFSLSIYSDGSIRFRYHEIMAGATSKDLFGIFGSRASSQFRSNNWYHQEVVDYELAVEGNDIIFCPEILLLCPSSTCVVGGGQFSLNYAGPTTCLALGDKSKKRYFCSWSGGLVESEAQISIMNDKFLLSCDVPYLDLNTSLISVDIKVNYSGVSQSFSGINDNYLGSKSFYASSEHLARDGFGHSELAFHHIMVTYNNNGEPEANCGCKAWSSNENGNSFCDACNVCRNSSNTSVKPRNDTIDCSGNCFGRAYLDGCNNCSGGLSGAAVDNSCAISEAIYEELDPDDNDNSSILSQLLFVVIVICCMSCLFSMCMFFGRGVFMQQSDLDNLELLFIQTADERTARNRQRNVQRGLTLFERDALGEVLVDSVLLKTNLECAICLLNFKMGDVCRVLPDPCGHCFHKDCVDKWFDVSICCPLCKRSIKDILLGERAEVEMVNLTEIPPTGDNSNTIL